MSYFDIILEEVLEEDLESKMPMIANILLNDKSIWPGRKTPDPQATAIEFIHFLAQFDPSNNQQYVRYIATQVAKGNIKITIDNPEDGPIIQSALEIFMNKRKDWPGFKDVFQYKNWHQLHAEAQKYIQATSKLGSNRDAEEAFRARAREHTTVLLEHSVSLADGGLLRFKVYKITDYSAAALLGRGTTWCTSASLYTTKKRSANENLKNVVNNTIQALIGSKTTDTPWEGWTAEDFLAEIYKLNGWPQGGSLDEIKATEFKAPNSYLYSAKDNADSYIKMGGCLYIIYKDGEPYIQATSDGSEIRNVEDVMLSKAGNALAKILVLISRADNNELFLSNVADMIRAGRPKVDK